MKRYLITSPQHYGDSKEMFLDRLGSSILKHSPDFILYRDKSNPNYKELAKEFISFANQYKEIKKIIHQDIDLAQKLGADGVHLNSLQIDEIPLAKSKNLEVIVSTHSLDEVLKAQKLGADAITYSPIFHSPNKGEPKGVENLKDIVKSCDIKVFALGGIVDAKQIEMLQDSGVYGFASIRYFF